MPFPLALIPAIAGLVTAIGSKIADARAQKKQNEANQQLAKYSYQMDADAVAKQNAYNSPAMQMSRYQDAGLNPNLIYGSGQASAGLQNTTPRYQTPDVQYKGFMPNVPDMLGMYQDFQMKAAQIDNVKSQTENTRSRTINEALRGPLLELQGQHASFDLDTKEGLRPYQFQTKELETRASRVRLEQEFKRLALMNQQTLLNQLEADTRRKNLTTQDLMQESLRRDNLFKQYRNDWKSMGIESSDNILFRVFSRMIHQSDFSFDNNWKNSTLRHITK